MTIQTITLDLPEALYERVKQNSHRTNRSIEAVLLEMVAYAIPEIEELPNYLITTLESMKTLDDKALGRLARNRMSTRSLEKMEQLHHKQGREGLTTSEIETVKLLEQQYADNMLLKAQATDLLRQRGHDSTKLFQKP